MVYWIQTSDGSSTLLNPEINELYHSRHGAWSECRHVFVDPFLEHARLNPRPTWRILDLGFGLGLNWLCVIDAWLGVAQLAARETRHDSHAASRGAALLRITSIENDPAILNIQVSREQLGQFQIQDEALELLRHYKMYRKVEHPWIQAKLLLGNAVDIMGKGGPSGQYDVIFHDPFSPKKNLDCWSLDFFKRLARNLSDGAVLFTYSVAGTAKKALKDSGFKTQKRPGFVGKRECLIAIFEGHKRLEK